MAAGAGQCITVCVDRSIYAHAVFKRQWHALTDQAHPSQGGSVHIDPASSPGGSDYTTHTWIQAMGIEEEGYVFDHWDKRGQSPFICSPPAGPVPRPGQARWFLSQGGRGLCAELRLDGVNKECVGRTALRGAGGNRRPDALAPLTAFLAPGPWVVWRSITTKRMACSARLLVGPISGVVMNSK